MFSATSTRFPSTCPRPSLYRRSARLVRRCRQRIFITTQSRLGVAVRKLFQLCVHSIELSYNCSKCTYLSCLFLGLLLWLCRSCLSKAWRMKTLAVHTGSVVHNDCIFFFDCFKLDTHTHTHTHARTHHTDFHKHLYSHVSSRMESQFAIATPLKRGLTTHRISWLPRAGAVRAHTRTAAASRTRMGGTKSVRSASSPPTTVRRPTRVSVVRLSTQPTSHGKRSPHQTACLVHVLELSCIFRKYLWIGLSLSLSLSHSHSHSSFFLSFFLFIHSLSLSFSLSLSLLRKWISARC